jgi:leader peptidase (prepilin peptidase) / N-methyltransferase
MISSGLLLLLASPFVGSFIGSVADRLPVGRPILWERSSCDHCNTTLGVRDLVPFLSWIARNAKCGHCRNGISIFYPLVEGAAVSIAAVSLVMTTSPLGCITIFFGWGLLVLAVMDLRHMVVVDWLCGALMVSGLAVAAFWSKLPFYDHVLGVALGAAFLYLVNVLYRAVRGRDGLGMGDVILLAAAGAWVGWQGLPSVLLYASVSALLAVVGDIRAGRARQDTAIPFCPFLCLGAWLTWLVGPISWSGEHA